MSDHHTAGAAASIKSATHGLSLYHIFGGRRALLAYALVPAFLFFFFFWIYPLGVGFQRSLTNWSPMSIHAPQYVGLANYQRAFADKNLGIAIANSLKFAAITVSLRLLIAMPFALMLNNLRRGQSIFRLIYFLPVVTSVIAAGVIWRFLYLPRNGILNTALTAFQTFAGVTFDLPRYLQDPNIALFSIAVMSVWRWLGFVIVILMAGLSSIPDTFYEAAQIDGANPFQRFRSITLPLLRPTLVFILVTEIASEIQVFTEIYVMATRGAALGGPAKSTLSIVILFYQSAFKNFEFGYASAIAVIIFVIIATFSVIQLWLGRRRWDY